MAIPNKSLTTESGTELLMSYGMFSDIMRILGSDEDTLDILLTDETRRSYVIRRLFTDNKTPVSDISELINPYDIDVSILELDTIIAWVADHIMHFTMSTAQKTRPVVEKYQAQALKASSNQ